MESQILRCPDVVRLTGLSKATVYREIKAARFPEPLQIGPRAVGWRRDEIEEWIKSRERAKIGFLNSDAGQRGSLNFPGLPEKHLPTSIRPATDDRSSRTTSGDERSDHSPSAGAR